jgi:diacylglycerol kinase (ATP)
MPASLQSLGHALAWLQLQMRICLFWNPGAGGGTSLADLTQPIVNAGHDVVRVVDRTDDLRAHLTSEIDCVVAAGGDGTIARGAAALAGGDIPLALLPLGTANNIAGSLGLEGSLDELIGRWQRDRRVPIDIGFVEHDGRESSFVESVGFGLVTDCIDTGRRMLAKDDPAAHLDDARDLYLELLARAVPQRYSITIDGEALNGDYLLVEALNTPRIGPRLELTSALSSADGLLSVVCMTAAERPQLHDYLDALHRGGAGNAGLKSWRAGKAVVRGASRMHVDDGVEEVDGPVTIRIEPASLLVLA